MNPFPKSWKVLCNYRDQIYNLLMQENMGASSPTNDPYWELLADIEDAICEINSHYQRQFTKKV